MSGTMLILKAELEFTAAHNYLDALRKSKGRIVRLRPTFRQEGTSGRVALE